MPVMLSTNSGSGTPSAGSSSRSWLPSQSVSPSLSREQFNSISMGIYNRVNEADVGVGAWEHIGRWALGTGIDLADSVWSTPLNPVGERGDVWDLASAPQKEYYERHKGLIEGSSALAGGVLTAVAAEALVIPRIAGMIASSTALTGTAAWRASEAWNVVSRTNMLAAQRAAAAAGESFSVMGSSAGRQFLANRSLVTAAKATRTLPIDYAVMWNNDAFNSGEWSREGFAVALGAVAGGAVGAIGARALVRQTANSVAIQDVRQATVALAGASNSLLSPDYLQLAGTLNPGQVHMKESALTTTFLLAARSANPNGLEETARNASKLNTLRNQSESLAIDSLQKLNQSGIGGVQTAKGKIGAIPEIENLVKQTAKSDPFVLHGVSEMGVPLTSIKQVREERTAYIESLFKQSKVAHKNGNIKEAQRLARLQRVLKKQDDFVLVNGNWLRPESELAKATLEFKPDTVLAKILPTKGADGIQLTLPGGNKVMLDAGLTPLNGKGSPIDVGALNIQQRLTLNEAAGSLVRRLTAKNAKAKFKLTDKSTQSWFSLDLATEILERGGSIEFGTTKLGLSTLDDLKRESLRIKARSLLAEVGPTGRITDEHRFKYNLPSPLAMERLEDSAGDGFRIWLQGAAREDGTLRELSQALTDTRTIQGIDLLPAGGSPLAKVDGQMLRFNRDKEGRWMRPMLAYFDRETPLGKISQGAHRSAVTLRKAESTAVLINGPSHVNDLARGLIASPEFQRALNVTTLADDQITGLGGAIGQAAGELLPKRFRFRDNATLLAASKIQEAANRHGLANFAKLMDSVKMQDEVTLITSSGHAAQRVMLDQYASLRSGWDIDDMVPIGEGKFGFTLADTETNRRRLGIGKNVEWEEEFLMNERAGKMLTVDATAGRIIRKFNQLTENIRESDNVLRRAKNQLEIKAKKWYTPPPDTKGALVGFVFDENDKLVPGRTIVAHNLEEWNSLYKRTIDDLGEGNGFTIRTRDQLGALRRDVWDEVAMDWIDPGIHAATSGIGQQKGGLTGAFIKEGAFDEMLDWVRKKSIAQSQDTVRQLMNEPILLARAQSVAERGVNPNVGRNIFDEYEMALTGKSAAYTDTAILDGFARSLEKKVDGLLANSSLTIPARYVVDLAERLGMNPYDLSNKKTYKEVVKSMGSYTPFANVTEYLESRGVRQPPTVKGLAQTFNTVAASVLLRWFELPHATMNLLGLVATIPAQVSAGRAPISTFLNVKGKEVGMLDGGRIISNAMKDMFSKRGSADWKFMERNGDTGQSVMEYHQQLGAIQSQAGFFKWAKQADKWASIATDTTENWSRQYGHFVGLRLADYHGIQGMTARHDFAREIANSAIADYAPANRPEFFGSGFGSMFGLFQSYALNHYTKMFRWMEQGQYKQFGLQAGFQATMFGVPGTYGLGQLIDLRDSLVSTGSEPTAVDLIYEHFGPVLGGAIVHGSVSQVTQLSMWSRGDTNFRVPGASGNVPALDVGTKVARGFIDATSAFINAMPGEGTHAALEAIQRNMPNRIMRSWLTLLNDGQEIDAYGQTMVDTQNWLDTVARVVGLRSTRQQSELEAYYASRGGMERDAGRMETLRESFRSAVRNNNGNMQEVNPVQYFNDYVAAGGNPRMFKTWVTNLLRDSDNPRSAQQLRKSLATPRSALELWRYGAYGAWDVN